MSRPFIRCGLCCAVALGLSVSAWAANNPKGSTASADPVQELLQSEPQATNESVDRRDVLKPDARPENDSNTVWWQAGYTKSGKQWVRYEESLASGADEKLLDEYQEQRSKLGNQPHGEWQLANWCRKNGLSDQERVHLLNVLSMGDSVANRDTVLQRLGCRKVGDQWISPKEQQDIAKQDHEIEQSHKRWDSRIQALIPKLDGSPKQRAVAEMKLVEMAHPSAVPAIVSTLCMASQSLAEPGVRALGQIPEYEASRALAGQAVFSPWKPVRRIATESLKKRKLEEYVPDLLLLLSNPIRTKLQQEVQISQGSGTGISGNKSVPRVGINLDYVWVEETRDTIHIGIRRLFPVTMPAAASSNFIYVFSVKHPELRGVWNNSTGQRGIDVSSQVVAKELAEQADLLDFNAEQMNDFRVELNERVGTVLADCTSQPASSDPKVWWDWWTNYSSVDSPGQKNVVIVDERPSQPNTPSFSMRAIQISCLVASTPVWTERGLVPIESIRPGDRVLSKDIATGELGYKPVLVRTERPPTPVWKFVVGTETIEASLGHHFWVSGDGWNKTRTLAAGKPLHTATGMQRIFSVEDEGKSEKVYNLVVADFHTYFVGNSMILSHDVTTPSLTNVKTPGLATK